LFYKLIKSEILWKTHIYTLSDNILFQLHYDSKNINLELIDDNIHNRALHHLQIILNKSECHLSEFPNMPIPSAFFNNERNHLIREE
jgi:hypothetical protein